ncbi:putative membrane protein YgcG [Streptomyces sp. V4I8]|uniref:SCO2400 family protein n=1 Tax=Streptomyces sp. V4I8 TaxID=3156469 RepID=UPI003518215A
MDYCSSCRRHLNGALVCPGCGAYAPDIAPSAVGGPTMSAAPSAVATGTAAWEPPAADTWYDGYFRDETVPSADLDETAPDAPPADVEGVPVAPEGRAARRRQRARWKKNQRRAVVATAVALVGGGLTVSAMNRGATDKTQAATAPVNPNTAAAEQQATELTRPVSTPPDTREAPRTDTSSSRVSPTDAAREPVTTQHTTRQFTRPDVASTPSATATTDPQSQAVTSAAGGANSGGSGGSGGSGDSGSGGTAAEQEQTPAPTATDSSGSDSGSDSGTSTSPSSPAPEATSPAQLCVLNLVCLG